MKNKLLLLISIALLISSNTYCQSVIFTLSNGNKIEVASNTSSKELSYEDALKYCDSIGNGWRIPTKAESKELYLHKSEIGGFIERQKLPCCGNELWNAYYWTSSPDDIENYKVIIAFKDGYQSGKNMKSPLWVRPIRDYNGSALNNNSNNTQTSNTPVSSLPDGDIIWKHSKGSFEINGKEGDKRIWHEDGGRFIYVEQEFYNDGTMEGSGQLLKRKNENVFIKLTLDKCYYKDNNNQNWILIYNGGFYSKTLARYLVVDDFNKSSQSTSTTSTTSTTTTTSQSNITVNKTVSNYKFTPPPALKINYIDNRKMCCCCNEKYGQYKVNDKKRLEITEKILFSIEKLALYHKENGNGLNSPTINKDQIDLDLKKVQEELLKIYPNFIAEISIGSEWLYNSSAIQAKYGAKICSTERNVNLYDNVGDLCSSICKNKCGSCR